MRALVGCYAAPMFHRLKRVHAAFAVLMGLGGVLSAGCGLQDAAGERLVVAHRAAAGRWPENSRVAVQGTLAAGYPAFEVDIVLTQDGVPVLAHDPWVSEKLCTTTEGAPLEQRVLIKDLTLDALRAGYVCGGVPDPDNPDAEVVPGSHMTLDELIAELSSAPTVAVYLDLKYGPLTLPIEDFRQQILSRWRAARLPNPLYVEATLPEGVRAFADEPDVHALLGWPRIEPGSSGVGEVLGTEFAQTFGFDDPSDAARDLGAEGFTAPYQVLRRRSAEAAYADGLTIVLYTLNETSLLDHYCGWPVDQLITDYPERAPCL